MVSAAANPRVQDQAVRHLGRAEAMNKSHKHSKDARKTRLAEHLSDDILPQTGCQLTVM